MSTPIPQQAEYRKLPTISFSENKFHTALINGLLKFQRFFFRPKKSLKVTTHSLAVNNGGHLKLMEFSPREKVNCDSAIVYFHGGGFFLDYGLGHLRMVQDYALKANTRVFMVDYRLSGKHPFPAPFNDCYQSLEWVHEHSESMGIDQNKIIVMGDSAGGALAASVAQRAVDEGRISVAAQCLIYPVTDCETKTDSAKDFTDARVWNTANNLLMWRLYLQGYTADEIPQYASPIHRNSFSGLPPAYIEVAELDPLRDEGLNYAEALRNAGVEVNCHLVADAVHAYDFAPRCEPIDIMLQKRVNQLKKYLGT